MDGFAIVTGSLEKYLSRSMEFRKKKPEEAYVFSEAKKNEILKLAKAEGWQIMPGYVVRADYDSKKDTTIITGELIPAYPEP